MTLQYFCTQTFRKHNNQWTNHTRCLNARKNGFITWNLTETSQRVQPRSGRKTDRKLEVTAGEENKTTVPPPHTLLEGTTGKVRNRIGVNSNHLNFPNFPTSSITSKKQTPKTTTISEHYNTTWDWLWLNPAPLPPIIPQWNTNTVTFSPSENEPHRNSIEGTDFLWLAKSIHLNTEGFSKKWVGSGRSPFSPVILHAKQTSGSVFI